MTLLGDAYVRVRPDTKGFEKETKSRFGGIGKSAALAFGAAFAAAGVGKVIASAVTEASDLGESVNAVNVSFGKAADGVLKLGQNAAKSMGLSNVEFNGLAVRFSSFATTIAGKGGDVTKTLESLTGRAADFASVMNLDVADAAALFQSGLAGESEPLRKYGIDISAATIETYAYANGIAKSGEKLTEAQKVQARYGSIMEQTNKTAGDFSNTSDSLANSQRILGATWDNLKAKAGNALVPALASVSTAIGTKVLPGLEELGGSAKQAFDILFRGDFKGGPLAEDSKMVDVLFNIREALTGVADYLGGKFREAYESISKAIAENREEFDDFLNGLKEVGAYISTTLAPIIVGLVGEAIDVFSASLTWAIDNLDLLKAILVPITAAIVAYKAVIMVATAMTKIHAGVTAGMTAAQWLLNAALTANPIGIVIALVAALVAGLVYAWRESETFREIVVTAFNAVKDAVATGVGAVVGSMLTFAEKVLGAAEAAFGWIPGLEGKFEDAKAKVAAFKDGVNASIQAIKDKDIVLDVQANGTWTMSAARIANEHSGHAGIRRAMGGAVLGKGSGTSDSIPAWLSNGEHVWTAKEVANAGGHAAVSAMRNQFKYAKGGAVDIRGLNAAKVAGIAHAQYQPTEEALLNAIAERAAQEVANANPFAGGGGGSALVNLGKSLLGMGFRFSEHPAFGGVNGKHAVNSRHYAGRAIDVNYGPGGQNATEMRAIDGIVGAIREAGFNTIWRAPGHFNHLHVDYDQGGLLEPGITSVYNRSGKPEAVLTNSEWGTLKRLATGSDAGALVGGDLVLQSSGDTRDDLDEALFQLRRRKRGGR